MFINVYNLYKDARNAAWQCLIDAEINSLPVKTLKITSHLGIDVLKNSEVKLLHTLESGCCMVDRTGKWMIVFDDTEAKGRIRFTVAHEIGHILLGHELEAGFRHYRRITEGKTSIETQADEFAIRLLSPACVLKALDISSPNDIAEICDISQKAAEYRAERINLLLQRGKFLTSPLEKKVFENFLPWIERQKQQDLK